MEIFCTDRLSISSLTTEDKPFFIELLSAPEIIDLIPQKQYSPEKLDQMFLEFSDYSNSPVSQSKTIWGIYEINKTELIGICALLTNEEEQREIGYRLRKKYWKKGYGSEATEGLIEHCFTKFNFELITADVNIENTASVKILDKFLLPHKEFFNVEDNCYDRRYLLTKKEWNMKK